MKNLCCLLLLISSACFSQNNQLPLPLMSTFFEEFPNVRDISISNNGNELYFTVESYKKEFSFIAFSKNINGKWTKPEVASFSGKDKDLEPFLSPDNLKLYFASNRNIDDDAPKNDFDIWYVERENINEPWSKPKNIGEPINTENDEFYPSVTASGNLYFTATRENDTKGKEDIYISKLENGIYLRPESLSSAINSETYEFNAFISPDEKMILFSSYRRPDAVGVIDLYISIKDENGIWLPAKNIGKEVNSKTTEFCPFIDFNTNTLYFTSDRSVQTKKNEQRLPIATQLKNMKTKPNGLSRIYYINFDESFLN